MKRKIFSVFFALVLVLSFSLVTAVPAGAVEVSSVFQSGGDRLVETQNSDGGWPWPLLTGDSAPNTPGPIAIGLAQAYRQTEDPAMYAALEAAGGFLLAEDHYFTCWDGLLAVELDDILDVTTYTDNVKAKFYDELAAGTYVSTKGGPWYTEDYIAAAGYAWDLGIGLASAVSVGIAESEIDKWITGVKDAINATPYPDPWFLTDLAGGVYGLAYAGETEFLGVSEHFSGVTTVAELAVELASMQDVSGCFDPGFDMDGQNTAYALLALNQVDSSSYVDNIAGAGAYLDNTQLETGGWENYADEGENNEMTAEALWALASVPVRVTIGDEGYYTIQAAINAASPLDTIIVAAGTYTEQLTIDEAVTLDGANAGINAVTGTRGDESIIDVSGFTGDGILVTADTVTIDGFEIIGIPYLGSGSSKVNPTIAAEANSVTVRNCVFNSEALGKEAMVARPGTNHISFLDNKVNNYMFGITARGLNYGGEATLPDDGVTYLTVSGNTFNVGYVDTGSQITGEAVQIHYGDYIVVTGNTINGPGTFESCEYDLINSIGIADFMSGYGAAGTITYSNNEITNCYVGIGTFAGNGEISGNAVTGNNIGIQVGQNDDVYISTPAEGVAITGNDIQNNIRGIWAQNFVVDGLAAHFNNITGNTEYGVLNEDPDVFDATNNWWGSADGPFGTGANPVSENVAYDPWLNAMIDFTPSQAVATMTATYTETPPPTIGIEVLPISVPFGDVVPGIASGPQNVTVTNTGDLDVDLSAEITAESHTGVYSTGLTMDDLAVGDWSAGPVAVDGTTSVSLVLTVPTGTAAGTYTGTLTFWAEAD